MHDHPGHCLVGVHNLPDKLAPGSGKAHPEVAVMVEQIAFVPQIHPEKGAEGETASVHCIHPGKAGAAVAGLDSEKGAEEETASVHHIHHGKVVAVVGGLDSGREDRLGMLDSNLAGP